MVATEVYHASSEDTTRIFVVKIASRCNLSCSYCYMYQHPDQSWKLQPQFMSHETVAMLAKRLEEHACAVGCRDLMVVAHGGEPLLYPELDDFFDGLRRGVTSCNISFAIQTNGTLFDDENLAILDRYGVRIGVSVDGSRRVHDRFRVTHAGGGSYDAVMEGIGRARATVPHLLDSTLQVINPSVDPAEMLDGLEGFGVNRADLLFPDLNHDTIDCAHVRRGQIGHWLCAVFDEWVGRADSVHIRIFMTIIDLLLGGRHGTDQLGASSGGALMIETDGSYHIYDGLKTSFEGAGATGLHLRTASIADAEALPLARAFRDKSSAAAAECLQCRLFPVCGGGSPIHRFSQALGFDQASVYCLDLTKLIEHIRAYILSVRPNASLAC
jgi:uncharacterized protein